MSRLFGTTHRDSRRAVSFRAALVAAVVVVTLAGAGGGIAAAGAAARAGSYWLVLGSNRDGEYRAYSAHTDGSRLTPLLPRSHPLTPMDISRDGRTIAYIDYPGVSHIYVSRANGLGLHRVAPYWGGAVDLSPDGKLLAFAGRRGAEIVGTNGRGRRQLAAKAELGGWAPDGKSLVLLRSLGELDSAVVVQPLHGKARVVVPRTTGISKVQWSQDGRWLAYDIGYGESKQNGLYVVQTNGAHRHRVVRGWIWGFAWSPTGSTLAVSAADYRLQIVIVGTNGPGLRRLRLPLPRISQIGTLQWSPDGRRLALQVGIALEGGRILVVGADGRGLQRSATGELVGWTRIAPVRSPARPLLPTERVSGPNTVAAGRPITDLSADGARVAFSVTSTSVDCDHVVVWTPATSALVRFRRPIPCEPYNSAGDISGVELAGSRAAWTKVLSCGTTCEVTLESATLAEPAPLLIASDTYDSSDEFEYDVRGHGALLVLSEGSQLVRIGAGSGPCPTGGESSTSICTTLRRGDHTAAVDSVSGGLIAVREAGAVAVLDAQGKLVRLSPFGPREVSAARLDGQTLVVTRSKVIEAYDVPSGAILQQRPLPAGYRLVDVDDGIAVLRPAGSPDRADKILVFRLGDGRSFTLAPGRAPVLAELEAPGLYYSYVNADTDGRVVIMARAEVLRRLAAGTQSHTT